VSETAEKDAKPKDLVPFGIEVGGSRTRAKLCRKNAGISRK